MVFGENATISFLHFFEKTKHEHADNNMLDIIYAKQEVTFLNTLGTGDKNVMDFE